MPKTFTPIATYTVTGATVGGFTISSIPQTYTDLFISIFSKDSYTGDYGSCKIRFNGDGGSNYSFTTLTGDGSNIASGRSNGSAQLNLGYVTGGSPGPVRATYQVDINNYSNTTTNKQVIARASNEYVTLTRTCLTAGLWRSTAAITSITFYPEYGWMDGSTITIYGIQAA